MPASHRAMLNVLALLSITNEQIVSDVASLADTAKMRRNMRFLRIFLLALGVLANAHVWALTTSNLPTSVAELVKRQRFAPGELSFYVQAVDQDQAIIAHESDRLQVLASTAKLPTTLAALHLLGPKFQWRTNVFLRGKLHDGVLDGDVLVVGGGDPSFDADSLKALMTKLRKRGLKEIRGNVVINRSAFALTDKDHALTPIPNADRVHHVRPDALIVNQNMITIEFEPAGGGAFKATMSPALHGVELVNKMQTAGGPCLRNKSSLDWELKDIGSARQLILTGSYPAECGARRWEIAPLAANEQARLAIHQAWLDAGGTLSGEVLDATAPPSSVTRAPKKAKGKRTAARAPKPFVTQESASLLEVIDEVNKWSNNVLARHLFLSLTPEFPRRPATIKGARELMQAWLERQEISPTQMQLDNGSGLSREEKGMASAMGRLLVAAYRNDAIRPGFLASLPVVGVDGTMGSRLKNSAATGKAFIKTGTLTGVRAVAGYVTGRSGKTYALVAIANAANAHLAQAIHDKMIEWIVTEG